MSPIRKVFNIKKNIEKKKYYRSWTLSDELWERVKNEIPQKKRDPEKESFFDTPIFKELMSV